MTRTLGCSGSLQLGCHAEDLDSRSKRVMQHHSYACAGASGFDGLTGRVKGYAQVVHDLNEAEALGQPFDTVAAFGRAAAADSGGG